MKGWRECKLGDIASFSYGMMPKKEKIGYGKYPTFSGYKYQYLYPEYNCEPGDLIVVARGVGGTGDVKIVKEKCYLTNLSIKIDTNKLLLNNKYFYYANAIETLRYLDSGSAQSQITINDLVRIIISVPPLHEQKAIASVLSSLDDKIDLLHRQNKTLEAMGETLFRQWFVEEAEEGWEEDSLLNLIQLIGGGTPKTSVAEYWDGNISWLAGGDITSNHKSFVHNTEKTITENGLKNSSAKLLPKYATVISARGTVGKYCLLAQPMAFSQSNYGILPRVENCYFFTYLLINHAVEELQASAYGSVFDTITTTTFKEHKVHIPSESEIRFFEETVALYFYKIFNNKIQIRTLEKLRDTLLSKLMNGDVRVVE